MNIDRPDDASGKEFLLKEKYDGIESPEYEMDASRLATGEPLAYVIGWIPFLDCRIFLDSRPLIPRPETEFWTEKAIQALSERDNKAPRVLDLFAGSGCVGVAVLKHLTSSRVDFGEIDMNHFPTILKNIRENGIKEERAEIVHTDVWSSISGTYDAILANPPYLSESRRERVETAVLSHEPEKALFADEGGFALIRRLIGGAYTHLNPKGIMYIEHEPEQVSELNECASESGFRVENRKDQYGVVRYSVFSRL